MDICLYKNVIVIDRDDFDLQVCYSCVDDGFLNQTSVWYGTCNVVPVVNPVSAASNSSESDHCKIQPIAVIFSLQV
jgi:hypothetical protein